MIAISRTATLAVLPLLFTACTTTTGYRHKDGSITISQRGPKAKSSNYWIAGAKPGQIHQAENLSIFRRETGRGKKAVPLKCEGFIDTTFDEEIGVRLIEKQDGGWRQSWANGRHKLIDESAPKPFYHWLIP